METVTAIGQMQSTAVTVQQCVEKWGDITCREMKSEKKGKF